MKISEIKGDAVKLNRTLDDSVLIHVCNDQGVMGSGIALQIKKEHPNTFKAYRNNYTSYISGGTNFGGSISWHSVDRICNLVAQASFGVGATGKVRYLNYGWLALCLAGLSDGLFWNHYGKEIRKIIVPVNMGAFRAGGDWEIVKEMIIGVLNGAVEEIIFCEFDGE